MRISGFVGAWRSLARFLHVGLLVTILAGAGALTACSGKSSSAKPCSGDGECPAGATCVDATCAAIACTLDGACPSGSVCAGSACTPGCHSGLDCRGAAALCDTRKGDVGTCAECLSTTDCKAGRACVAGACVQACDADAACDTGHCDVDHHACVACLDDVHCPLGQVCADHACAEGCDTDGRCPVTAPYCLPDDELGTCAQCRGDADCHGATCRDGSCVSRALDVLVVVDNSANMAGEQARLMTAFPAFLAALDHAPGGRPDLHIGVVSTNMGSGATAIAQCTVAGDMDGDGGELQHAARITGCAAPTDAYLSDVAGPAGRVTNFTGDLKTAFSCIASLGDRGCGFEQPLAAMQKALDGSVAANAGFLRPGAALAVLIFTNEDDCTATDTAMFGLPTPALGPQRSIRCFELGVQCNPDTPREVGAKARCVPRAGSPYMALPTVYADFLRGLRSPSRIAVGVIAAVPGDQVELLQEAAPDPRAPLPQTMVAHQCVAVPPITEAYGDAAIRLRSFVESFGAQGVLGSVCGDYVEPMTALGNLAAGLVR